MLIVAVQGDSYRLPYVKDVLICVSPLAARKPKLGSLYPSPALAVSRAQLDLLDLPEAVTANTREPREPRETPGSRAPPGAPCRPTATADGP